MRPIGTPPSALRHLCPPKVTTLLGTAAFLVFFVSLRKWRVQFLYSSPLTAGPLSASVPLVPLRVARGV